MDLVNRLKYYLEENKIAISQFADKCRIPRPTLSQILNGRNKKISDELITKIHDSYPDLSVLWLMFGEGEMVTRANTQTSEPENDRPGSQTASYQLENNHFETEPNDAADYPENTTEKTFNSQNTQQTTFRSDAPISERHDAHTPEEFLKQTETQEGERNLFNTSDTAKPGELNFAAEYDEPAIYSPSSSDCHTNSNGGGIATQIGSHAAESTQKATTREPGSIVFMNTNPLETTPDNRLNKPGTESQRQESNQATETGTHAKSENGTLSVPTLAGKKITNIVVFYSDNSFQSFSPTPV